MPPTGAPERDHDVHASLLLVKRQQLANDPLDVVQQTPRRGLLEDEVGDLGVASGQVAQLRHPVRVVEKARVDHQSGVGGRAVLVRERKARHEGPAPPVEVLGQLPALAGLDAVVGALVGAARMAIGTAVVDEHVLDGAPVGLAEELGAAVTDPEDEVGVAHAVQLLDTPIPRRLELGDRGLHALAVRRADDDKVHGQSVSFSRAARRSGMPSFTISSTGASRIACTEPKCRSSARLRAGPIPSTESSGEVSALRARTLRWWVMAKRCASSRTRWTRNMPGELCSCTIGSARPGAKISSRSLASANVGMSAKPASSSTSNAAPSCPLPPSMRIRSGRLVKDLSPAASASSRRSDDSSLSRRRFRTSCSIAKSLGPGTYLMRKCL